MPKAISRRSALRRALLVPLGAALSGGALVATSPGLGAIGRATTGLLRRRPNLTHGIAAGDAHADGALVWARSDVPATMIVETAATGLEPGRQVHYRVTLEGDDGARGEPLTGVFTTAPVAPTDVKFLWSGDVVGQGWGINADTGGMTVWSVMADRNPDFFIHSADAIYADNPVAATQKQNDGRTYRNVTAPGKAQVAQTLDQFRGNYQYNLSDHNYLRFNSEVAQYIQWDDHETLNNWYPGETWPVSIARVIGRPMSTRWPGSPSRRSVNGSRSMCASPRTAGCTAR